MKVRPMVLWGLAALAAGLLAWATGALPPDEGAGVLRRAAPVLAYLAELGVIAGICEATGVFDVAARLALRAARGGPLRLLGVVAAASLLVTWTLSLDTAVLLLTPIVIRAARRASVDPTPHALAVVWLANAGSLLVPGANLTNLIALEDGRIPALEFPARLALPQLAIIAVVAGVLVVLARRRRAAADALGPPRASARPEPTEPSEQSEPSVRSEQSDAPTGPARSEPSERSVRSEPSNSEDGPRGTHAPERGDERPHASLLAALVAIVAAALAVAIVVGVPAWIAGAAAALLLAAAALWLRRRDAAAAVLRAGALHIPFAEIAFAIGLFLVVAAAARPLAPLLAAIMPGGDDPLALAGVAGIGALVANVANNLPAYLALADHAGGPAGVAALLVGVNAGPVVLLWGSLANLLWRRQAAEAGWEMGALRFALLGLAVAVPAVAVGGLACALPLG